MPRTSKRKYNYDKELIKGTDIVRNTPDKKAQSSQQGTLFRVAIYGRLSSDHDESGQISQSESLEVQINIVRSHIDTMIGNGERMELHDIYTDMGKTGTNFNRDEFARMMQDVRMGEINCIMVKDLSRFGRDYLEAGNYIEKIFPFLGVRFIAVTDGFDTGQEGHENRKMAMNIKNLINDMYAKEISKKAKLQLKQRRERGEYVGGPPPYGYTYGQTDQKDLVTDRKAMIIDRKVEPIIKMIFALFIEEKSYDAVARRLNAQRINPPLIYRKTGEVFCPGDKQYKGWRSDGIRRIVGSTTYAGTLTQGKTSMTGRSEANRIKRERSDWIVTPDSHAAIISRGDAIKVQQIIATIAEKSKNKNKLAEMVPLSENIFARRLFCGSCGRKMTRHSITKQYKSGYERRMDYFDCPTIYAPPDDTICESNRIGKEALMAILIAALRTEYAVFLERPRYYIEENERLVQQKKQQYQDDIRKMTAQIERMEQEQQESYRNYREKKLDQSKYIEAKQQNRAQQERLQAGIKEADARSRQLDKMLVQQNRLIKSIMKLNDTFEPTRDFIESLVERIVIYPGKRVEMVYSFAHPYEFEAELRAGLRVAESEGL